MGWTRIKGNDLMGDNFVCPHCHQAQTYGDTPFCPMCGNKVREMTEGEINLMKYAAELYEEKQGWL